MESVADSLSKIATMVLDAIVQSFSKATKMLPGIVL